MGRRARPASRAGRASAWASAAGRSLRAFLPLLTPAIILGGIFGGIFTATEAAAIAALYALILGAVVYRELGWRDLLRVLRESMNTTAVVGFIVAAATLFNWVLARERVPQQVAEMLLGITDDPLVMLLLINLLLLFLGMFMEALAVHGADRAGAAAGDPWRWASTRCISASSWC